MCVVSGAVAAGALGAGATAGSASAGLLTGVTTLQAVMMDIGILSTGFQVMNAFQTNSAMSAEADANARMAEINALNARRTGEYNAQVVRNRTAHDKLVETMNAKRDQSRMRTLMAKGRGGSPLQVLAGMAGRHELNMLNMTHAGELEAEQALYAGRSEGFAYGAQASGYRARAANIRGAMPYEVGESLLSGGGRVLRYYREAA